jgi:hypothetical protein
MFYYIVGNNINQQNKINALRKIKEVLCVIRSFLCNPFLKNKQRGNSRIIRYIHVQDVFFWLLM